MNACLAIVPPDGSCMNSIMGDKMGISCVCLLNIVRVSSSTTNTPTLGSQHVLIPSRYKNNCLHWLISMFFFHIFFLFSQSTIRLTNRILENVNQYICEYRKIFILLYSTMSQRKLSHFIAVVLIWHDMARKNIQSAISI